jgi:hypothetical protein
VAVGLDNLDAKVLVDGNPGFVEISRGRTAEQQWYCCYRPAVGVVDPDVEVDGGGLQKLGGVQVLVNTCGY